MTHSGDPSGPLQYHAYSRGPRITAVETAIPSDIMPGLLLLRIHTDAGTVDGEEVIGHGETYYIPEAASAVLHDWMAQRLLGADAAAPEAFRTRIETIQSRAMHKNADCEAPTSINQPNNAGVTSEPKSIPE